MSFSAIDAMLRERRLAAMLAEVEDSLNAPLLQGQPGSGDDPNQLLRGSDPNAGLWTSTGAAPGTEFAAAEPPDAFPMSAPTMNVAAAGWPTGVRPRPGLSLPFPPDAWEPWRQHSEQGIQGLIDAWRRAFGGVRGGGGDAENECLDRWEREHARCTMFRPFGYRYQLACEARANDRHKLCYRNGGKPDPSEPPEYNWQDIPRDSPRR
jgi:hypothetical protein